MADLIDDIMGFNPSDMSAFQEKGAPVDPNVYKTNPCKMSKAEDGHYRAKIKILLNPFSPKDSIVPQASYWLAGLDGSRLVRSSLSIGDKNCPIFRAWKRQWFAVNEPGPEQNAKRDFAKSVFNKNESQWVLVQILEDENQPELVGQFRIMKLARDINEKLAALANPSASSKKSAYPVLDYVVGLALELDVQPGPDDPTAPERKTREISYSLCQFGSYEPIIKTDGSPLLTEEEIELVDAYVTAAKEAQEGKTAKKKEDAAKKVVELRPQLRPIYAKAIEYVRENLVNVQDGTPLDLVKYCGYLPWDEDTTAFVDRWIEMVDDGVSPKNVSYTSYRKEKEARLAAEAAAKQNGATPAEPNASTPVPQATQVAPASPADDGLPF